MKKFKPIINNKSKTYYKISIQALIRENLHIALPPQGHPLRGKCYIHKNAIRTYTDYISRIPLRWNRYMLPLIRSLIAPLLSLSLFILASGLFNTFISIRLEMEGYTNETIGAVASSLYAGLLAGSFWLDRWIAKIGHTQAFKVFATVFTFLVLAQSLWMNPYYWGLLRFAGGACLGGVFIVIESWLLMQAPTSMRGGILSIYLAVLYGALSASQFLINLSSPMSIYPFFITAFLSAISILPLILKKIQNPKIENLTHFGLIKLFRISPLGFVGGIISGSILATIYGLVPVYAKEIEMSISNIGNLMALLIFGGLLFQWPMGHLADVGNRRKVLLTSSYLASIAGFALALIGHQIPFMLFVLGFIFGGFSFTIYPLSMAYICEKISNDQIVSATGGFVLSYGIGAILGPLIAPVAMNLIGPAGLFYFLSAISFILVLIGLKKPI